MITSEDGSSNLYLPELDETYHNRRGALTESEFIFIERGFKAVPTSSENDEFRILEIGMGTGLNVLLTQRAAEQTGRKCKMVTLEPFPLNAEEWEALNYGKLLEMESEFNEIHESPWTKGVLLSDLFTLTKFNSTLEDFDEPVDSFDLIYMDAFAPSRQSEIWSVSNLKKLYDLLTDGGILVTYCAQGQFKRDLHAIGFETEHPAGPLGKKEMTIAKK